MSSLRIAVREATAGPVVEIDGELDHVTSDELRTRVSGLALKPAGRLTIHLAGMEFCDSSGITALLAARNHAIAAGADIVLAAVPANTMRILRIAGLDQVFRIEAAGSTSADTDTAGAL
ncbi:STAS domain-containing protein [Streptomyces sp. NPDC042319]|uniref:STAS domain-containing protein n=1 Tax=Streptomyces sp. NPDC042319 TaxID=3154332 RepID=UPI0033D65D80